MRAAGKGGARFVPAVSSWRARIGDSNGTEKGGIDRRRDEVTSFLPARSIKIVRNKAARS